jgi:hypothetical protein
MALAELADRNGSHASSRPVHASADALHPPRQVVSNLHPAQKAGRAEVNAFIVADRAISAKLVRRMLPRIVGEWLHGRTLPSGSSV